MRRWILVAALLAACGGEAEAPPPAPAPRPAPRPAGPRWLRELLAFDLEGGATDARTTDLGHDLRATVACPQPGTGCFVELPLGGVTTQLHLGEDETIQIWGPVEPDAMAPWVEAVERELDASALEAVNEPGTRPDRLFRDGRHLVLLHDHGDLPCDDFCPAMLWIARPDHPAARGYGFPERE